MFEIVLELMFNKGDKKEPLNELSVICCELVTKTRLWIQMCKKQQLRGSCGSGGNGGCFGGIEFEKRLEKLTDLQIKYFYKAEVMGQKHPKSGELNVLDNWKPHAFHQDVFTNIITNEQVQRHPAQLSLQQEQIFKKRMQEHHTSIVRVLYYHCVSSMAGTEDRQFYMYTDRMLPLSRSNWMAVNSTLVVLKGFRRLSSMYNLMRVTASMIGMNEKGEIKLWINEDPVLNQINARADNEEQMLADISRIIINYDPDTAGLLLGCQTLNEAINNILLSLTQPRGQVQYSQRGKQDRLSRPVDQVYYQPKDPKEDKMLFNQSDRFRTRKATEEDWKNSSDPRRRPINENPDIQLLNNVRPVGVPRYIHMENAEQEACQDKKDGHLQKKTSPYQRFASETTVPLPRQAQSYQQVGYKQSMIQVNPGGGKNIGSYPTPQIPNDRNHEVTWGNDDRFLKLNPNYIQKSQRVGYLGSPTHVTTPQVHFNNSGGPQVYSTARMDPEKKSPWKAFKKSDFQLEYGERKSDLHQQFLHRQGDYGRISDFPPFIQKRKKVANKQPSKAPEVIDERRREQNEGVETGNRYFKNNSKHEINGDNLRTRTQDFSNTVISFQNEQSWNSYGKPRNQPYDAKLENNFPRNRQEGGDINRRQLKSSDGDKQSQVQKLKEDKSADNIPTSNVYYVNKNHSVEKDKVYGTESDRLNQKEKKLQKKLSEPTSAAIELLKREKKTSEEPKKVPIENQDQQTSQNYEEKKMVKQKMAKQLKMEFTSLLSPTEAKQFQTVNAEEKSLMNTKSSKDLLIKQKVEKKKATFAELKNEAMKILKDDLF